ncbi:pilus assembly protein [Cohnella lubricantis]
MSLEAALVMPIFLLAILFLIFQIQVSVASMALHGALTQTVRQAASQWYPVSLGLESVSGSKVYETTKQWDDKVADVGQALSNYDSLLPSPIGDWAKEAADGTWSLEQTAAREIFAQYLHRYIDERVLSEAGISVISVTLPEENDRSRAFLTVKAEYRLPMRMPFAGTRLVLEESARERVWISGLPSESKLDEGEVDGGVLSFVSISPNPAMRGRKVTLTLKAKPGEAVDLSVVYKSGRSQAKHLGSAVADSAGLVSWTWHVSGNTTPGTWDWEARAASGAELKQTFEVAAPGK